MATKTVCDICGREVKTHRLVASIEIAGAVPGTVATATSKEIDVCEDHWADGAALAADRAREQLIRDIPHHRAIQEENDRIAELDRRVKAAVGERDRFADGTAERAAAAADVIRLTGEMAAAERRRAEVVRKANE